MKGKRWVLCAAAAIILFAAPCAKAEESLDEAIRSEVEKNIGSMDLAGWDQTISGVSEDIAGLFSGDSAGGMIQEFSLNGFTVDGQNIFDSLLNILKTNIWSQVGLLTMLLLISLTTGLVRAMISEEKGSLQELIGFICYCVAVGIVILAFGRSVEIGKKAIDDLTRFIELAFPVLITMLSATGALASGGMMQPTMSLLCGTMANVIKNIVVPVSLIGGALAVLNNITGKMQLAQLYSLCKSVVKWVLGLTFTLYLGITALQGLSAKAVDGLSIRTAKFALDKFVPIVGGMVSGTIDTVLGCALLVKNAAGITAIVIAFCLIASPLAAIAGNIIVFRIAAAASEPIADPRLPKMFASVAEVLTYLFAAVVVLGAMFIITAGLIIGMNGSLMIA
ncbi:MAG: stage III sporulation protein AE [Bacillota bacterium]